MDTGRLHLLIVEDEEAHIEAIRRAYEDAGVDVEIQSVGTLDAFRASVQERPPDLALMDLKLPDGRAVEVLTHPPEYAPFPVLVMTAFGSQQIVVEVMKAGALDYVVKSPEAFATMPRTVERALREWALLQKHKRGEVLLQANEARYRSIFDNAIMGISQALPDGRLIRANQAYAEMYGYADPAAMMAAVANVGQLYADPDDRRQVLRILGEKGFMEPREMSVVRCDGSRSVVMVSARAIRDAAGNLLFYQAEHVDITKRKIAEAALRSSESDFRAMFETASIGMAQADPRTGQWVRVNQKMCLITGYSADELLKMRIEELTHPDDRQQDSEAFRRVVRGEAPDYRMEKRYVRKDGTTAWVNVNMTVIRDAAGQPVRTMATIEDITARKRIGAVQLFLAQTTSGPGNEPFFNALARYLAQGLQMDFVCIDHLEGDGLTARTVAVWCDGRFEDNVTYALKDTPCGDVVGKTVCCFPASVCRFFPRDQVLQDLRAESYIGVTLWSHTGQPIGLIAVIGRTPLADRALAEDMLKQVAVRAAGELERQQAEEALSASKQRHQTILQTAMDGIWLVDVQGRFLEVNEAYCRMSGYSEQELLAMRISDIEVVESAQATAAHIQKITVQGEDRFESRHRRKDGSIFDVEVSVQRRSDKDGQMVVFLHNITARKQAEAALRESERFANSTVDALSAHLCILDEAGTIITVNHAWRKFALANSATLSAVAEGVKYLAVCDAAAGPDSGGAAEFAAGIRAVIQGAQDEFQFEYPCHSPAENRWFIGRVTRFPGDGMRHFVVAHENITTRRQAEVELQTLATHQQVILATIPDIIMEVDNRKVYTWANQAGLDFFGADVVGKSADSFFEGEQDTLKAVQPLFNGDEQVIYLESWQRRKDGAKRLLAWWCHVLKDKQGHAIGALSTACDITEHRQAEAALRESEAKLAEALQMAHAGHWEYDVDRDLFTFNDNFYRLFRTTAAAVGGYRMSLADYVQKFCHPDDAALVGQEARAVIESADPGYSRQVEHRILYADGEAGYVLVRFSIVKDAQGRTVKTYGVNQDITVRKRAEVEHEKLQGQLQQAQKMDAVGRLAGGVAHDFNNMLGVIIGHADLAIAQLPPEQPVQDSLKEIREAAVRSADLTRHLLAFARKQIIEPKVLDLNETVEGMLKMLRRLIGEDIHLSWQPGTNLWPVNMDPSQVDQILANLCVNARDAIAGVGKVFIETGNTIFDEAFCAVHPDFVPGDYVRLFVSDSGCGMDKETQSHLFEPFFTTKDPGKGTGLGLATVYGIVKQNKGLINVYSEPGHGTTFKIYLPRHAGGDAGIRKQVPAQPDAHGHETILLVEDESAILTLVVTMLKKLGYTVLAADAPEKAIQLARDHVGPVHLLITDVIMPGMDGQALAKELRALYPRIRRLFMSGYTADVIAHHGVLDKGVHFIQKPFDIKALAAKIREVLDGK